VRRNVRSRGKQNADESNVPAKWWHICLRKCVNGRPLIVANRIKRRERTATVDRSMSSLDKRAADTGQIKRARIVMKDEGEALRILTVSLKISRAFMGRIWPISVTGRSWVAIWG